MLSKLLFPILLLFSIPVTSIAQETITNESIVQMVGMEFSDEIIANKINTSDYKFETSIADLSKLKDAGVSSSIIALIMEKSVHNSISKTGIYYRNNNDELELIQPAVFSGSSSNSAAQQLVSGLINSKNKAIIPTATSSNTVPTNTPEFTFIFDASSANIDNMQNQGGGGDPYNWWFKIASSPNEFVLLKLKVRKRKNLREIVIGKSNALGSSSGIDPKDALSFSIDPIEGNKFVVTPQALEMGEYAFFYQGQIPGGRSNQAVFDFSVK